MRRKNAEDRECGHGEANIKTTTIYAKVTKEDKLKAANALAKTYQEAHRKQNGAARWPKRTPPNAQSTAASSPRCA
jgi:type II secretory pathway pseudopilin PulG